MYYGFTRCGNVYCVLKTNYSLGLYSLSGKTSYRKIQNLVKSRSREIGCYNDRIALKFDRHLGSAAAEVPVKFQSDWKSPNPNLAASRLHEIFRTSYRLVNRGPGSCTNLSASPLPAVMVQQGDCEDIYSAMFNQMLIISARFGTRK